MIPIETWRFYHKDCKPSPQWCIFEGVHWHLIPHGSMQLWPHVHEMQLGTSARVFGVRPTAPYIQPGSFFMITCTLTDTTAVPLLLVTRERKFPLAHVG
eukprot:4675974-Amphidinium_carterae.1